MRGIAERLYTKGGKREERSLHYGRDDRVGIAKRREKEEGGRRKEEGGRRKEEEISLH
jgi:hypothetical protein